MTKPTTKVTDVRVKVVSRKGVCAFGHKVGDEWIVGATTPAGICNAAYAALYPHIRVLQRGGDFSYPVGSDLARMACPDGWNPTIFELSRVPETARDREVQALPKTAGHLEHLPYK